MTDDRLALLLETLARVAVSVDLRPTLANLLESLHQLVPFDAGGIFVRDSARDVVRAQATRGYPHTLEMPTGLGLVGEALRTGQPRLVVNVARESAYLALREATRAQLTVPLASPRGQVGVIVLEGDREDAFSQNDLSLVTLFGQQATVVIERAILHEQLVRQSRLDRDMEIAREIVRALEPEASPILPEVDIAGRSTTAEVVGGDAFDFIPYEEAQLGVSISDAKGKGIPGALLAVAHRAMLHALVGVDLRLRSAFGRMSELISRSVPPVNFITSFYGIVDVSERRMVYVNAGHPPPLVVRDTGAIDLLPSTGPALGFPRLTPIREAYTMFERGDGLVLYTDGVTEAGPAPDQFLDAAGLQACVRRLWPAPAAQICDGVLNEAMLRSGGCMADDATVVVMKFR